LTPSVPEGVASESLILALRLGVVALLYLFLLSIVVLIQRELRVEAAAQRPQTPRGRLIVMDPGSSGREPGQAIALEPVTLVGRSQESTLVLDDEAVSTSHAMLLLRDERWWIRDAGSTNGTIVNGRRIGAEMQLRDGDELQMGQVKLRMALS